MTEPDLPDTDDCFRAARPFWRYVKAVLDGLFMSLGALAVMITPKPTVAMLLIVIAGVVVVNLMIAIYRRRQTEPARALAFNSLLVVLAGYLAFLAWGFVTADYRFL